LVKLPDFTSRPQYLVEIDVSPLPELVWIG
jgi:hypothetical protein